MSQAKARRNGDEAGFKAKREGFQAVR